MMREMMKSKLHRAKVTDANLKYMGSITIDEDLMEAANLIPLEKVQVLNINNGARFETYVITGERQSGTICLNGADARLVKKGDEDIIISYALMTEEEIKGFQPSIVFLDEKNDILNEEQIAL